MQEVNDSPHSDDLDDDAEGPVEGDDLTVADDSGSVGPDGTRKLEGAAARTEGNDLSGAQFGEYRLVRKIAKGGMGLVYEGVQLALDRRVAIKIIADELASDQTFLQRFEREAKASALLNHPNVAQVYDFGREGDRHYLVLEYVDGMDFAAYVKQHGKLAVDESLAIVRQVALALQFALGQSIIHRDIKPANLMYTTDGTVKITDLGLAKKLTEDSDVTLTGAGIGSPHYLAPEQADDARAVDHRADIYSLGITLMFLLTARRPFDGESAFSVVLAHANKPLPSGEELGTPLPEEVESLVRRMTAKNPVDRHMDYDELLADLDCLEAGKAPAGQPGASGQKNPSGRGGIAAFAAMAVICVLVVVIVMQSGGNPGDEAVSEGGASERQGGAPGGGVEPAPEKPKEYPPFGSEEARQMLSEMKRAIIRHFLPKAPEVRVNPIPDGELDAMIRVAEQFAAENPEEYRSILAHYDQIVGKVAGTPREQEIQDARKTWQDKFHEADEKAFNDILDKLDQALLSKQPHTVFAAWEQFPKNLLSEELLEQAVDSVLNLPGPFVGELLGGEMPQMPVPDKLRIPDELMPSGGLGNRPGMSRPGSGQGPGFGGQRGGRPSPPFGGKGGGGGFGGQNGRRTGPPDQ